jgi:hypothetical protein
MPEVMAGAVLVADGQAATPAMANASATGDAPFQAGPDRGSL